MSDRRTFLHPVSSLSPRPPRSRPAPGAPDLQHRAPSSGSRPRGPGPRWGHQAFQEEALKTPRVAGASCLGTKATQPGEAGARKETMGTKKSSGVALSTPGPVSRPACVSKGVRTKRQTGQRRAQRGPQSSVCCPGSCADTSTLV